MEAETVYTVITADIVDSRKIRRRQAEQERIITALQSLNACYAGDLTTLFSLSAGDQIQAVAAFPSVTFRLIRSLRGRLFPLQLRCGIGFGTLSTAIDAENSGLMDGPAFHMARRALDSLKSDAHGLTRCEGLGEADPQLNVVLRLLDTIQARWTSKQWVAVDAYERAGTYEAAGQAIGLTASAVYQRCNAAGWEAYRRGEELAGRWVTGARY